LQDRLGCCTCSALAAGWHLVLPYAPLPGGFYTQLSVLSGLRTCGWLLHASSTAECCITATLLHWCTGLHTHHTSVPCTLCRTACGTVTQSMMRVWYAPNVSLELCTVGRHD
jgi:hypothetical protein